MRRLLQFVLMVSLLLSGEAVSAATMPCCAQAPAVAMQAEMQMSAPDTCHDPKMSSSAGANIEPGAAFRCPRTLALAQPGSEWKNNERTEPYSPLYVTQHLSSNGTALTAASSRIATPGDACPPRLLSSHSLPLRI